MSSSRPNLPRRGMTMPKKPHLRLLPHCDEPLPSVLETAVQLPLFFGQPTQVVALVSINFLEDHAFVEFIKRIKPRLVLDVRTSPRFNYGLLTRKSAFALFRDVHATYIDLLAPRVEHGADPVQHLVEPIRARLKHDGSGVVGPIVLITDSLIDRTSLQPVVEQSISSNSPSEWKFIFVPTEQAYPSKRSAE